MSTRKALALGAISGLRSASGPAFVARAASSGDMDLSGTTLAFLGSPRLSKALTTMQLGEIVVDKLPIAPGRTALLPLLGRAASGGLVGGAVFISEDRRAVTGALLGALRPSLWVSLGERTWRTPRCRCRRCFLSILVAVAGRIRCP